MIKLIITTLFLVGIGNFVIGKSIDASVPLYTYNNESAIIVASDDEDPEITKRLDEKYGYAYFSNGFYHIKQNGKYGLCNTKGEELVPPKYDNIQTFYADTYGGYTPVENNGKQGLLDKEYREVLPCLFDDIGIPNVEGSKITVTVKKGEKSGLYDLTENKEIVPCVYDEITDESGKLIPVKKGDLWGLFELKSGKELVPCKYDNASFWDYEGCGFYYLAYDDKSKPGPSYLVPTGGTYELYDFFSDVHGLISGDVKRDLVCKEGKYGIINEKMNEIVPCKYDYIKSFYNIQRYENLPPNVVVHIGAWDDQRFVIVHQGAKVNKSYESNGEYYYKSEVVDGGLCGVYDIDTGKEVIPCKYSDFILVDTGGLFTFCEGGKISGTGYNTSVEGGKWGIIDARGKIHSEAIYDTPVLFTDGIAHVSVNGVHSTLKGSKEDNGDYVITAASAKVSDVDQDIPSVSKTAENTFAFVIANENYQQAGSADYAIQDGKVFCDYCKNTLGIPEKNLKYYEDATFGSIQSCMKRINDIADAYESDASIILYFSGLGITDPKSTVRYLLPVDGVLTNIESTGVNLDGIIAQLNSLKTKSTVVLIDAPFSGNDRLGKIMGSGRGVAIKAKEVTNNGNVVVCMSGQSDGISYSSSDLGHGLFTYSMLKKLKETKGNCTLQDIMDFCGSWVKKQSVSSFQKMQVPSCSKSQNINLSNIKF